MRSTENTHHESAQNRILDLLITMVQGDREDQQDSFGYQLESEEGIVVICDGMGGFESGKLASRTAVDKVLSVWGSTDEQTDITERMKMAAKAADKAVASLRDESGKPVEAGSTMIMLVIDGYRMYWNSVGDSRIYLFRKGEFVQATVDQNYRTVLHEQLAAGQITEEEYGREVSREDALVNYLGIGKLSLIDCNETPLQLEPEDRILMVTDGLYRVLSDEEMCAVLNNFLNVEDVLSVMERKAQRKAKAEDIPRDNTTAALIRIRQRKDTE